MAAIEHHRRSGSGPRRRSSRTVAGVVAAALALGACAGNGVDPDVAVPASPDATAAAGVAFVTIDRFLLHAEGEVDLARSRAHLVVSTGGPTKASSSGATGGTSEVLVVEDRVWTRPVGGTYVEVDTTTLGLASLPEGLVSGDPLVAAALVRAPQSFKVFGGQQVQEASTIRYDLRVDPLAAAAKAGLVAPRIEAIAAKVNHPVRVDAYLDPQGRLRRIELPEDLTNETPVTRPDASRVATTIDFVRFGVVGADLEPPT